MFLLLFTKKLCPLEGLPDIFELYTFNALFSTLFHLLEAVPEWKMMTWPVLIIGFHWPFPTHCYVTVDLRGLRSGGVPCSGGQKKNPLNLHLLWAIRGRKCGAHCCEPSSCTPAPPPPPPPRTAPFLPPQGIGRHREKGRGRAGRSDSRLWRESE